MLGRVSSTLTDRREAPCQGDEGGPEAVVLFARRIAATLVVTGVDSVPAVSTLRSLGANYGQGALFATAYIASQEDVMLVVPADAHIDPQREGE